MIFASIQRGVVLGLGAAAPIGPVNIEIARRVLRSGFLAGFLLGLGAVTVDVTYAILSTLSVRWLLNSPALQIALGYAGGALLAYLGILSLVAAWRQRRGDGAIEGEAGRPADVRGANAYLTGLAMTFSNPMTISFWFLGVPSAAAQTATSLPYVCVGVFIGTFTWVNFFAGAMRLLSRARRWLLPLADVAGGITLLWFAGGAIWRAARLSL